MKPVVEQLAPVSTGRRWWQKIVRAASLLALVILSAYVTLPWWLPAGFVGDRIAGDLASSMGVPVEVGSMSISWAGVELKDIVIDPDNGFGRGPLVEIKSIAAPFEPLKMLFGKRLEWVEIIQPRFRVAWDDDGNLSLAPLTKLKSDIRTGRVSVRDCTIGVQPPRKEAEVVLCVRDAQVFDGSRLALGRVSVSAHILQDRGDAPLSISFREGGRNDSLAGAASIVFSNVDLSQLPPWLLSLRRLSGRCSGSVAVEANKQGQVEQFEWKITARDLEVEGIAGPPLPRIGAALASGAAAVDLVGGMLEVKSFRFRMDGMDLAASGAVNLLVEPWIEGVSWAQMSGRVYPEKLSALLGGLEPLGPEIHSEGAVDVRLSVKEAQPRSLSDGKLHISASANADETTIIQCGRVIKPPGRALEVAMEGVLDVSDLSWASQGQHTLRLGGNIFRGGGEVRKLRRFVDERHVPAGLRDWLAELAYVSWKGSFEIDDLAAVCDLLSVSPDVAAGLDIRGPLSGGFSLDHAGQLMLHLAVLAPRGTTVRSPVVTKAQDDEWRLVASSVVSSHGLEDINLHLLTSPGRLHLFNWRVEADDAGLALDGGFDLDEVQDVISCFTNADGLSAQGRISGKAALSAGAFRLECDLENAGVDISPATVDEKNAPALFRKPRGELGLLTLCGDNKDISLEYDGPIGHVIAAASMPPWDQRASAELKLNIRQIEELPAACPMLAEWIELMQCQGSVAIESRIRREQDVVKWAMSCDVASMSVNSSGVVKPAGMPSTLQLEGQLTAARGRWLLEVQDAVADVGGCFARLNGRCEFPVPQTEGFDLQSLEGLQADLSVHADADAPLLNAYPRFKYLLLKNSVKGEAILAADVKQASSGIEATVKVDLSDVAIGPRGGMSKPAGLPATVDARLSAPAEMNRIRLRNLHARLGDLHAIAAGDVAVKRDESGSWVPGDYSLKASASCEDLSCVAALFREMATMQPAGCAFVSLQCDSSQQGVKTVELITPGLSVVHRGRSVSLAGRVALEDVVIAQESLGIGRFVADRLRFEAGANNGWVSADVADPLKAPSGRIRLIARRLDDKDIIDWLSPPALDEGDLDDERMQAVGHQAQSLAALLEQALAGSRLDFHGGIDHLRTFDTQVKEYYDTRYMEVKAGVKEGRVRADIVGGLNGGTIRKTLRLDFNDPDKMLTISTSLSDVAAIDNMQPQISRHFPGNTVHGMFNREDELSAPLAQVLAQSIDPRYPLTWQGSAKTVTIDGLVEGQSAPSFVTRLFPGLNLTQYHYDKMTGFATFNKDGSADNDMIFSGSLYDLYMTGVTDADNVVRYEVGLILLNSPQTPEWNHLYKLGRIPLLKVHGRIVDAKLVDQVVSYPWPNESLGAILIKNNLFYRIWLNRNKENAPSGAD